ncbi:MAG: putative bifunctional diguanylate cyclase/phosphodiesterase [Sphingomonas sp.]
MRLARANGGRPGIVWMILAAATLVAALLGETGFGAATERLLSPLRFAAIDKRASGGVVVVAMDAASTSSIKRWPWSRKNFAGALDRLRAAGAASIAFDVDFSSLSDPDGDQALAGAMARAQGRVVLPTFAQPAGANDWRMIDALPIEQFREHAALASVMIAPDPDGIVRSMPFGTITADIARPTLSAFIAGRSGSASGAFPIDMSINPGSIPQLSFVAVRDGHFDPAVVKGHAVLIGATAIEMGDRYATPVWGVIPGVMIQALAAETLLRGAPVAGAGALPIALAALMALGVLWRRSMGWIVVTGLVMLAMFVCMVVAVQHLALVYCPIAPGGVLILLVTGGMALREIVGKFRQQRLADAQTGLPNRLALLGDRSAGGASAVVAVQISNYDSLLAVLGDRPTADAVLRVAERVGLCSRDGRVFRVDDRTLAVLLNGADVDDTMAGLRNILLQPVDVAGRRIDVAVSAGVAQCVGVSLESALADATLAADNALRTGAFWCYAHTDRDGLARSLSLMGELDEALASGQIEVFYQPKLSLRENRITSVEALVRWSHPVFGMIGPDQFIPHAEQSGRIGPLSLHVLEVVLRDSAAWRADGINVSAAVNISAKLLSAPLFNGEVERVLAEAAVPPDMLIFEVTESAAISDPEAAIAALCRYRDMGVLVSIDDYGTGQSTLSYLRQLPLSEIKLDRSFVQHCHENVNDGLLVRSTVDLAHDLGLRVVAEGVEVAGCLEFLRAVGCDYAQGYLVSRPQALADVLPMLAAGSVRHVA